ncbi:putative dithiol-disulfide oxidoreductase (DUF899 family) [Rhizobium tibeticum]|uniref:DUF899 family protein n=1 Tax=Rhizobium tibeticum TaxID=501024 RepID=UPI002786E5E7|nr:DUF899 family protein [Rhizobium tibeticum]MDP9807992.1 putative dithiol-disulfide oxidoreductase (DUF899 family) [Rhizobium tibeticum]
MDAHNLVSAKELAKRNGLSFPNESPEYRQARDDLLAEEIELRRHIERVAEQRRSLPLGGQVTKDYRFQGADGEMTLKDLFADKPTLVIYNYMYGPQRERPCPMCTSMLSALDGEIPDIRQQVAFAVVARSPIERLLAFKKERGWQHLPLYCDTTDGFSRDYHAIGPDGSDDAAYNVFTIRNDSIHHFWNPEMGPATADPGQDPRGAPDFMPLWTVLDTTPEGRPPTWYPSLTYNTAR